MEKVPNAEVIAREVLYFNGLMFAPASWHYRKEYTGYYGLCESGMGLYLSFYVNSYSLRKELAFMYWHPDAGYSICSTKEAGSIRTDASSEVLSRLKLEGLSPSEIANKIKESRFAQYPKRHSRDRHNANYIFRDGGAAEVNELNYRGYIIIRDPRKRGQSSHWRCRFYDGDEVVSISHALRSGICRLLDACENRTSMRLFFK